MERKLSLTQFLTHTFGPSRYQLSLRNAVESRNRPRTAKEACHWRVKQGQISRDYGRMGQRLNTAQGFWRLLRKILLVRGFSELAVFHILLTNNRSLSGILSMIYFPLSRRVEHSVTDVSRIVLCSKL